MVQLTKEEWIAKIEADLAAQGVLYKILFDDLDTPTTDGDTQIIP